MVWILLEPHLPWQLEGVRHGGNQRDSRKYHGDDLN
jgi:nicotinamide riboside kinase